MVASVLSVSRFPVKGMMGETPDYLEIDPRTGIVGDRRYGLRRLPGDLTQWASKSHFHVGMNAPRMVIQKPIYRPGWVRDVFGEEGLDVELLNNSIDVPQVTEDLIVQDTGKAYNLCDTREVPTVSLLSQATLSLFSKHLGAPIDERRFRMNVVIGGLEPFEELAWADVYPGTRELSIGKVRFKVHDACERCPAIHANPVTGQKDTWVEKALRSFMEKQGPAGYLSPHRKVKLVMGILLQPLSAGRISTGDELVVH